MVHTVLLFLVFVITVYYCVPCTLGTMDAAKTARANAKRKVTTLCNNIARYIAEEDQNVSDLTGMVNSLKISFGDFQKCHDSYATLALESKSETEYDLDFYFDNVQTKYVQNLASARSCMKSCVKTESTSESKPETKSSAVLNKEIIDALNLPKIQCQRYNGSPTMYHSFIKSFKLSVEQCVKDPATRLTHLLSFLDGPAYQAVQSAIYLPPEEGYKHALTVLKERFGENYMITQSIIRSLRSPKSVRTVDDMRSLSDEVNNAYQILKEINCLQEVNTNMFIFEVTSRLPQYLQTQWNKEEMKHKRTSGGYLGFKDLNQFLSSKYLEYSDPLTGVNARAERSQLNKRTVTSHVTHSQHECYDLLPSIGLDQEYIPPSVPEGAAAFDTNPGVKVHSDMQNVNSINPTSAPRNIPPRYQGISPTGSMVPNTQTCALCKENHFLMKCPSFRKMEVKDRVEFVTSNSLCSNCLRSNHQVSECQSSSRCFVCSGRHTAFLHVDKTSTSCAIDTSTCMMPIVEVMVNNKVKVKVLLDTASSVSFCTESLVEQLDLQGTDDNYILNTMSGSSPVNSKRVSLEISANNETLKMSGVKVVSHIPVSTGKLNVNDFPHLQGIDLSANLNCDKVELLLGQDCVHALVPLEVKRGTRPTDPVAIRYLFGWTLNGKVAKDDVSNVVVCNFISASASSTLLEESVSNTINEDINKLWDLENAGYEQRGMSVLDKKVIQLWDDNCQLVDNHYVLPIPWKDPDEPIPNNISVAQRRLDGLVERLEKNDLYETYEAEINKLLDSNYAEIVPAENIQNAERVWYLPHHYVISKTKNKIRLVFDCASRFGGKSLNERCLQGPDLVNKLLHVLLRFRTHEYAVQADVKECYHQVRIPLHDRDALRFLWYRDGKLVHYRMCVHLFGGVWCSSSSTYSLRKVIQDNPDVDPIIKEAVMKSMYVDDLLQSLKEIEQVYKIVIDLPLVLQTGGFVLTKFAVNDEQLLNVIPLEHRAKEVHTFVPDSTCRALGVKWKIHEDVFCFDVPKHDITQVTRRNMLRFIASIYDPLNFIAPWVNPGKLLLQDTVKLKLDWDAPVPANLCAKWEAWIESLYDLKEIRIPRCIKPRPFNDAYLEFHVFSDANSNFYGSSLYAKFINASGQITTHLVMSKSHLVPLNKEYTIPRVELLGAKVSVDLFLLVRREMQFSGTPFIFWSDSSVVLSYIASETRRFNVFVENRVNYIRQHTETSSWNYVNSRANPADLLTKYRPVSGQGVISFWLDGPAWLQGYDPMWSKQSALSQQFVLKENDPEVKKQHTACVVQSDEVQNNSCIGKICEFFSSWDRVVSSLAWLIRFVHIKSKRVSIRGPLTSEEFDFAHDEIIRYVQSCYFGAEIDALKKGKPVPSTSHVLSLNPFLDQHGILRVGGRINKHPILLSHHGTLVRKLVTKFHSVAHVGCEWLLSSIRDIYWITKARRVIRSVIHGCMFCKRNYAKPTHQIMADLHESRIQPHLPPFTYIGMDCFGPYLTSHYRGGSNKRYGLIITCLTSRAVHIEMLRSLEAEAFLNAFRRYISRRGSPRTIFTDHGTNFIKSRSELQRAFHKHAESTLKEYSVTRQIDWKLICVRSPHTGGSWERLVGVIKRVFKAILPHAKRMSDEILETTFCEAEAIINGRPLTKLSSDVNDHTPLTPNTLLTMRQSPELPPGGCSDSDAYRSRWRYVQHLSTIFWHRWVKEYLPTLNTRSKWKISQPDLKVGELVLVSDSGMPRNLWPLALVREVYPGRDGKVRTAKLKTRAREIVRPVSHLVRLELDSPSKD